MFYKECWVPTHQLTQGIKSDTGAYKSKAQSHIIIRYCPNIKYLET